MRLKALMQRSLTLFTMQRLFNILAAQSNRSAVVTKDQALPGNEEAIRVSEKHVVNGNRMYPPFPDDTEMAMFGLGCFWGAERKFWQQKGVYSTQAGYSAGYTKNPTYKQVCTGGTYHNEVVRVVFRPEQVSYADLVALFFESHNPTQGMRQGNDVGTQYRSGIYYYTEHQRAVAEQALKAYQAELDKTKYGQITTEIQAAGEFYYAEDYHQQYLHKNPDGYCGLGGMGVSCPRGIKVKPPKENKDEL